MKKNKRIISIVAAFTAFFAAIVACTFTVDSITLPDTITAGEDVTFTARLNCYHVQSDETTALVLGILVPKAWNVGSTISATFSTETTNAEKFPEVTDGTMSLMADTEVDPATKQTWVDAFQAAYGSCGNYGLTEWIILKSDPYLIGWLENVSSYVNVSITFKAPASNDCCNLGVAFTGSNDGFQSDGDGSRFSNVLSTKFNVTGGVGRNDYTVPPTVSTTPLTFSYEDIFAINFVTEASGVQNALYGEDNIYLMGSCELGDGSVVTMKAKSDATLMVKDNDSEYHKYIYPRAYFNVPEGKEIVSLNVWMENESGAKKVDNDTYLYPIEQNGTLRN